MDRPQRPRRPRHRFPVRATLLVGLVMVPLLSTLTFAGLAYASSHAIRLAPVSAEVLEQIAASWRPASPTPAATPSPTGWPTFQPPAPADSGPIPAPPQAALPSPTPDPSWTPEPTASETPTPSPSPTLTATFTPTPTFTPSPTTTPTGTASPTPSPTLPAPTASRTPSTTLSPTASRTPTAASTATSAPPGPSPTASGTAALTPTNSSCSPVGNAGFENTLLGLINQERAAQGLPAYAAQAQLQAAARLHSTDMACKGFLSHTGSDGSSVGMRVNAQGYSWSWVGENILGTSDTSSQAPQAAFNWWMGSAPHRANLLSPNYTEIGLGYIYVTGSPYGGYFTAVFAKPSS